MCSPVAEAGLQIFSGFQASDAAKEQGKAFDNAAQIEEQKGLCDFPDKGAPGPSSCPK